MTHRGYALGQLRACVTTGCPNQAKEHFCTPCWTRLPWDLKAAMTSSRRNGNRRVEHQRRAKEWLDDPINQPKGESNAVTSAGN